MRFVLLFISSCFIIAMSVMMWRGINKDYSDKESGTTDEEKTSKD